MLFEEKKTQCCPLLFCLHCPKVSLWHYFFQNCSLVIIALVALPTQKHLHIENYRHCHDCHLTLCYE